MFKKVKAVTWKRAVIIFFAVFLLTTAARAVYEIVFTGKDIFVNFEQNSYPDLRFGNYESKSFTSMSNVATERIVQSSGGQSINMDQKYEKTANITCSSESFTGDNATLRRIISDCRGVIQSENLSGLDGNRTLDLTIGVMPDSFDDLVERVQSVFELTSFSVNKVDKTNEYRELIAQKETLEKSVDSYTKMKERGGDLKDMLTLEEKILDTQAKIQNLGVNLGIYSSENSFCTVNFSMRETRPAEPQKTSLSLRFALSCVKDAFFWTLILYAAAFAIVIVALFGLWIILYLYAQIRGQLAVKAEKPSPETESEGKQALNELNE